MKRLLVIDALNMYFRAYIVDPSLSTNGQPIGGLKGFLKILQKLVRETTPDGIVICWDGIGGSQRKKTMNKDYKAGRKPLRFNRRMIQLDEKDQAENTPPWNHGFGWDSSPLLEALREFTKPT